MPKCYWVLRMLNTNACENVTKNVTTALSAFGKSRKTNISASRRKITTTIEAPHEIEW